MKALKSILLTLVLSGMLTVSFANNITHPIEGAQAVATELTNTEMSETKGGWGWLLAIPTIIAVVFFSSGGCTQNSPTGPSYQP